MPHPLNNYPRVFVVTIRLHKGFKILTFATRPFPHTRLGAGNPHSGSGSTALNGCIYHILCKFFKNQFLRVLHLTDHRSSGETVQMPVRFDSIARSKRLVSSKHLHPMWSPAILSNQGRARKPSSPCTQALLAMYGGANRKSVSRVAPPFCLRR